MTWTWRVNNRMHWSFLGDAAARKNTHPDKYASAPEVPLLSPSNVPPRRLPPRLPKKREWEIEELTEDAFNLLTPKNRRLLMARYRRKLGI